MAVYSLLQIVILIFILLCLGSLCLNLSRFKGLTPANPPADAPLISILVPARNEERGIEACVRSLLKQDWPSLEVVVLDDNSEDRTGEILASIKDPRLKVISGSALPAGWVGKNWACHQLSLSATGDWLLFTDADTQHEPGAVSAAYAMATRTNADLLSSWPRLVTGTLGEALIIPIVLFVGMIFHPHALITWLQEHPAVAARIPRPVLRTMGAANGQMLLFRRASYHRIGGHAALANHLVEDVAFGREVAARMGEGMRLVNCEALLFSTCRMYHSLAETWSGFTKNARAVFEGNSLAFLVLGLVQFGAFVWPFIALLLPGTSKPLALAQIAGIYAMRGLLAARFRTSWTSVLLHPVGLLMALAIGLHSAFRLNVGGVEWKGRRYVQPEL